MQANMLAGHGSMDTSRRQVTLGSETGNFVTHRNSSSQITSIYIGSLNCSIIGQDGEGQMTQATTMGCIQFSSVTQSCLTLCNPMDCSMPGFPVHHQFPGFTQTHVHWVSDTIQPSHPLLSPSPPALNLSQHQCLFKWIGSLHQVAKVLEFPLQHQSFQWIFRTDFL